MNYEIIPAIIAHDQGELDERIQKIKGLSPIVQLDVMDGRFVQDSTFAFSFALPKKIEFEAHLMVRDPFSWIKEHKGRVASVIVHAEALPFALLRDPLLPLIKQLHESHTRLGLALNPETPVKRIRKYLEHVDIVLVMTVKPGAYGAAFLPEMLHKIEELRRLAPKVVIEVDGGIDPRTLKECRKAGATSFVVGSYLQQAPNIKQAWQELHAAL